MIDAEIPNWDPLPAFLVAESTVEVMIRTTIKSMPTQLCNPKTGSYCNTHSLLTYLITSKLFHEILLV